VIFFLSADEARLTNILLNDFESSNGGGLIYIEDHGNMQLSHINATDVVAN